MSLKHAFWLSALSVSLFTTAHAAGVGLPTVPVVSPIVGSVLPGGGGAGGGGGGGTGGGGGIGGGGNFGGSSSPPLFGDSTSFESANARGNTSWGDPLGAELFGDDTIKAHVHYYGDAGSQRSQQAVGLTLSIAN
jgi:hypothetical protein